MRAVKNLMHQKQHLSNEKLDLSPLWDTRSITRRTWSHQLCRCVRITRAFRMASYRSTSYFANNKAADDVIGLLDQSCKLLYNHHSTYLQRFWRDQQPLGGNQWRSALLKSAHDTCSKFLCQRCQESSKTGKKAKRLMLVCAYLQCLIFFMSVNAQPSLSLIWAQCLCSCSMQSCTLLVHLSTISARQGNKAMSEVKRWATHFLIPSWLQKNQNVSSFLGISCIEGDALDHCYHQKYNHNTSLMALKECERCHFLVENQWARLRQACCWVNHASCETRCWKLEA